MKILYAEDEPFLSHVVSDGLIANGYQVRVVNDGNDVMETFKGYKPDLCILDIMLPSKDGYMIAAELRAGNSQMPIIFLSAKNLPADVVKGFKAGGNDYLKKPFSMDELFIRVEALLSRFGKEVSLLESEALLKFGKCTLDILNQKLKLPNAEQSLSYKETLLLKMLIDRKNAVLKRQDALLAIWGDDNYYNNRSMDVFMSHIRKLLSEQSEIQIMSLRGIGYKLVLN